MLAVGLVLLPPAAVNAQTVLGAGPSGFVIPRGVLRVGVAQEWASYDDTFGGTGDTSTTRVALGAPYSADAFGTMQSSTFARVESAVRQLSGLPSFGLSLGRTTVTSNVEVRTTNIELDAGLGAGLSLGVVVPVVRSYSAVGVRVDPAGSGENVGLNPTRLGTTTATARNTLVKSQFDTANARLRQRYGACFTTSGGSTGAAGCTDVVALFQSASVYATTLARVYGTASQTGAVVVPVSGSAAQQGVNAAIRGYGTRFAALLGGTAPIRDSVEGARPAAVADVQTLLTAAGAGFGFDTLRNVSHLTLGDIEVGLRLRFLDTFHGREPARLAPRGLNVRSTVAGTFRIGTGHVGSPNSLFDVGTGDGQNDVEVGSFTDIVMGSRAWVSFAARYGRQLADDQSRRIPFAGSGALLPSFTLQRVGRDLGDYVQFEATPRYALTDSYALEGRYLYRRKDADVYTGSFAVADSLSGSTGLTLDAADLAIGSEQREQRVGGGVTYSTYAGYARRRSGVPLELSLSYLRTITGRGRVPARGIVQAQLRAFPRLFGGDWRTPSAPSGPPARRPGAY